MTPPNTNHLSICIHSPLSRHNGSITGSCLWDVRAGWLGTRCLVVASLNVSSKRLRSLFCEENSWWKLWSPLPFLPSLFSLCQSWPRCILYWQYGDKKSWHGLFRSFCRWNILAASLSSWRIDALSPLLRLRSPDTSSALPTRSFMYVSPSEKISDKKARYRPSVSRTDSRPGTSSPCLCLLTSAPQSAGEKLLAGSTTAPTMAGGEKRKHKINKIYLW